MINLATNEVDKEHATNPVPMWIINKETEGNVSVSVQTVPGGILADVAPTILELMNVPKPKEMTGASLLHVSTICPLSG